MLSCRNDVRGRIRRAIDSLQREENSSSGSGSAFYKKLNDRVMNQEPVSPEQTNIEVSNDPDDGDDGDKEHENIHNDDS